MDMLFEIRPSLWDSPLYNHYEDLNKQFSKCKLSNKFSEDYTKNMKNIYGGRILVFEGLEAFQDVNGEAKLGINHHSYIDSKGRVYDPFLGYYDIDLKSYLKYIGAFIGNKIVSYKII